MRDVVTRVFVGVGALLLVSGCTSTTQTSEKFDYEPPAWMAEELQLTERSGEAFAACLRDRGYVVESRNDGGGRITIPDGMSEQEEKAYFAGQEKATIACGTESEEVYAGVPEPDPGLVYERAVETRQCLVAQGYERLPEPPTRESYVAELASVRAGEKSLALWLPYRDLDEEYPQVTMDEWYSLKSECVEFANSYGTNFDQASGESEK